ncbi:MAG: prepilin-type N-terminal cleavage/methylation domain-containing protein [Pseudomonadota bacterium]
MKRINHKSCGFTLIEIMITLAISSIVMIALYSTFNSQQKSYTIQEGVADMQQNIRAAMLLMTNDIRMAGYDKNLTGNFGITDIRPRDINNIIDVTATGHSSIIMTEDLDEDGALGGGETIQYTVYDFIATDQSLDIARDSGAGRRLLAENIRGFGIAYAFDDDLDGNLDTYNAAGAANPGAIQPIIWAIDADGDNDLDTNLDTNLDGVIDINDSPAIIVGGTVIIGGVALATDVPITSIRAVRIWLLAETDREDASFSQQNTFVVGKYVINPNNTKRMRLLSAIIHGRNLGL